MAALTVDVADRQSRFCSTTRAVATSFIATLLVCLGPIATDATAQVSIDAQGQSGNTATVDEAEVRTNAEQAFDVSVQRELESTNLPEKQVSAIGAAVRASYRDELFATLNDLKGDGVLQAAEVTHELESLRQEHLDKLNSTLRALQEGHSPPPLNDSGSLFDRATRALSYTFVERNDLTDWGLFAGTMLVGLLVAWTVSKLLRALANKLRSGGRRQTAEFAESTSGPLYLAIMIVTLQWAIHWLWIPGVADGAVTQFVYTGLCAALFWFLWRACSSVSRGISWLLGKTYHAPPDRHVNLIVSRLLRFALVVAFLLILVREVLDSNLTGFVAGLGVLGVALSFILRSTIENIAASFTIFGDKPFRVGDLLIFDEQWGTIEDIGFRSTRFRTLDGHLITIPNSTMIDDAIRNVSARPSIRRRFRIGLTYDTPPEKIEEAIEIIKRLMDSNDAQPDDKPAKVVLEEFGDYDLRLMVEYHFTPADFWQAREYDSKFNLKLIRKFNDAGIEFAFPTQSVYLRNGVGACDA